MGGFFACAAQVGGVLFCLGEATLIGGVVGGWEDTEAGWAMAEGVTAVASVDMGLVTVDGTVLARSWIAWRWAGVTSGKRVASC